VSFTPKLPAVLHVGEAEVGHEPGWQLGETCVEFTSFFGRRESARDSEMEFAGLRAVGERDAFNRVKNPLVPGAQTKE